MLLALAGVYGVVAYGTTRRRREFGVRLALGASPRQIAGAVMGQGLRLGMIGLAFKTGTATRFDSACASIQNNVTVDARGRRQGNEVQVDRIVLRN